MVQVKKNSFKKYDYHKFRISLMVKLCICYVNKTNNECDGFAIFVIPMVQYTFYTTIFKM